LTGGGILDTAVTGTASSRPRASVMLRLRPTIYWQVPRVGRWDTGRGFDTLRVDHTSRRLRTLALQLPHPLPQQAVELGEHAFLQLRSAL
jgi:hypothetical protein